MFRVSVQSLTWNQLFENKIDHATYFGTNPEYIEGIHMLPLSPSTAYTRNPTFITEEWNAYFADTAFNAASKVAGGWRGILYGNYACVNPKAAWDFFSASTFNMGWIDGGASRTWYLAYSAGELKHQMLPASGFLAHSEQRLAAFDVGERWD